MKILSIIGHPNLNNSHLSMEFGKQLKKTDTTVNLLEKQHIIYTFNVKEEQNKLINHDRIVFTFQCSGVQFQH
ncbi:hypothetical protein Xbed_02705 [Xenorhabdus beddingii]|uniref:Uncharacterized protein n=1 Tax=Xenorhabdus beddingii TaxID=40578 RepID=A0A1Y2SKI9_9GAMM|nr:hypothetical protein Xbed_02705 [Xenorhabdus beddingii]